MDLKEFCKVYFNDKIRVINNHSINKVTDNSKDVVKNSIFVAVDGVNNFGSDYINEALDYGARTIIYSNENIIEEDDINYIKVDDSLKWYNDYLLQEYKKKLDNIKIIGVTGTNGKTTSTYITYNILKKYFNKSLDSLAASLILRGTVLLSIMYSSISHTSLLFFKWIPPPR